MKMYPHGYEMVISYSNLDDLITMNINTSNTIKQSN